jgi:hypothetical protein
MAHTWDTSCFFTTVKNISGKSMFFGQLPPHGRVLASNAEFSAFGSLESLVSRGDRVTNNRYYNSLLAAITNGLLQVTATPALILKDATSHAPKMVTLTSGTLGVHDPCYDTSLT